MGERSPECYHCEWLAGATEAHVGARFRGYNRLRRYRWETTAVITAAERGREYAFTVVHDGNGREETVWRYRFEPCSDGTVLTESFELLWCPLGNRVVELSSHAAARSTAVSARRCGGSRRLQKSSRRRA